MIKQIYSLLLVALLVGILSAAAPSAHAEFREEGTSPYRPQRPQRADV